VHRDENEEQASLEELQVVQIGRAKPTYALRDAYQGFERMTFVGDSAQKANLEEEGRNGG
jgi:hypothetical protein